MSTTVKLTPTEISREKRIKQAKSFAAFGLFMIFVDFICLIIPIIGWAFLPITMVITALSFILAANGGNAQKNKELLEKEAAQIENEKRDIVGASIRFENCKIPNL